MGGDGRPAIAVKGVVHSLRVVNKIVQIDPETTVAFQYDQAVEEIAVRVVSVRCQPHDFTFVAVPVVANELTDRRIDNSHRVWKQGAFENADVRAVADGRHGRSEIAKAIDGKQRSPVERRHEEGTCQMRQMMFQVVNLRRHGAPGEAKTLFKQLRDARNLGSQVQALTSKARHAR